MLNHYRQAKGDISGKTKDEVKKHIEKVVKPNVEEDEKEKAKYKLHKKFYWDEQKMYYIYDGPSFKNALYSFWRRD